MSGTKINEWLSIDKPSRYGGREWNIVVKDEEVLCRLLLAFPNTYEIGMSHLGLRILYDLINKQSDLAAERAFAPWPDREAQMVAGDEKLTSLETKRQASDFDMIGFSLQSELDFTNILSMLHLSEMPLHSNERDIDLPLVIAGGPVVFNPEPLSPFVDLFLIGDAEEQLPKLMRMIGEMKQQGQDKSAIIGELSKLDGIYIPALYETEIDDDSEFEVPVSSAGNYPFIPKALVDNLDKFPFPKDVIVPYCDIVHDRASVEIIRGCSRGCRFCQAGVIYMPERQRSPQSVLDSLSGMLESTGYSDVSLSALTPNDYNGLRPLVSTMMERFRQEGVSLSFASLSPSRMDAELLEMVKEVRKTGLTIAPEAGTQRMRDVINKGITEEEVLATASTAFNLGWKLVKLYFMIGLPTETDEDVIGIANLAKKVASLQKGVRVKIGCSNFVPKSHTPFQWVAMESESELRRKQSLLLNELRGSKVDFNSHDIEESLLEGVLSRGDRRVSAAIERAWELGCRFDGWSDHLKMEVWEQAFAETGIDPDFYNHRPIPPFARMPWSHIDSGVEVEFLREEFQKALKAEVRIRCAPKNCPKCRACPPDLLKERWGKKKPKDLEITMSPARTVITGESERYRIQFRKGGNLLSLGHLDLARLVARTFRRAGITVAMSQGFHPQPRISFALALPLGQEGMNEYFDVLIIDAPSDEELLKGLNEASPEGLVLRSLAKITHKESLSAQLVAADYRIARVDGERFGKEDLQQFISLGELEWKRQHKGKTKRFDIRGMVLGMENLNSWGELRLRLHLGSGLMAKPVEVVKAAFGLSADQVRIVREQLYISRDGQLLPPM